MLLRAILLSSFLIMVKCQFMDFDNIPELEDPDLEVSSIRRMCNVQLCKRNCRLMGFNGGTCIGERCKCDGRETSDGPETDPGNSQEMVSSTSRSCNSQQCAQSCCRVGFPGGVCVGDRCKCDIMTTEEEKQHEEFEDTRSSVYAACDSNTCYKSCMKKGYPGGKCRGNWCSCNPIWVMPNAYEAEGTETDTFLLRGCNAQQCAQGCRRMGFPGGVCVGDRCKCDIRAVDKESEEPKPKISLSKSSCNLQQCNQSCRRMGFPGGVCVGDRCKCDARSNGEDLYDDELITNELLRACDVVACNNMCHRLNYAGGMCRGGNCQCY